MIKTFLYIAVICAAMLAGVSCEKIEQPVQVRDDSQEVIESELPEGGDYVVKFSLSMADDQTRTGFDSGTGIEWKKGDKIVFYQWFFQTEDDDQMVRQPYTYTVTGDTKEIDANASFAYPYKNAVHYVAFYPKSNMPGGFLMLANKLMGQISLPENQIPSRNSYDPKADILISKYLVTTPLEKPTSFKLQFERMNAIGKMTIKNLQSASDISSLTFTAKKQSDEEVVLAGSTYYKFDDAIGYTRYDYTESSTPGYNTSKQTAITLDYSSIESFSLSGESGGTAYFCCYPFELGAGDSFTVKIITKAGEVFEKVVTLTAEMVTNFKDGKFIFARGQATKFTVNMSAAAQDEATVTIDGNTTSYPTIAEAFTKANGAKPATIKLMTHCTATAPLTISNANANITLNLNGKTISTNLEAQPVLTLNNGKLTITDNDSYAGKITNTNIAGTNMGVVLVQGGTLNVCGGTLDYPGTAAGRVGIRIKPNDNISTPKVNIYNGATVSGGAAVSIGGGGKTSDGYENYSTLNICGGHLIGRCNTNTNTYAAIRSIAELIKINISGGVIESAAAPVIYMNQNNCEVNITNGFLYTIGEKLLGNSYGYQVTYPKLNFYSNKKGAGCFLNLSTNPDPTDVTPRGDDITNYLYPYEYGNPEASNEINN